MTTSTLKIGVLGLGRMGQVYAYHVARQIPGAALVAVADPRPEALDTFAASVPGVTPYRDYRDLLAHPDLHAVIVATPTSTHPEVVLAATAAGKHIFCEKPMSLTLPETDMMIAAIDRAGVLFQVGFMRRFDDGYAAAKQQLDAGVIGQPVMIRSIGRDPHRTSLEYADPAVSGGLILDMGIHDFDLLRWLMADEVERVYSEVSALVYPELLDVGDVDNAMIALKFRGGGLGNVEVSRTAIYGYDIQCELVGAKGTLQVGYLRQTPLTLLTRDGVHHDVVPHFPQRFGTAYTRQLEQFVASVRDDKPPVVTARDARAALLIGLAATRSQHEQRVVYLSELEA